MDAPTTDTPDTTTTAPVTDTSTPTTGSSPLLVTSAASRAQYSTNETDLNTALNNVSAANKSYSFEDKNGNTQTIAAPDADTAIAKAPNIDPHSGVQENPPPNADGSSSTPQGGMSGSGNGSSTDTSAVDQATQDAEEQVKQMATLPPEVASQYKTQLATQDQNISDAKSSLAAATATLGNDPAAQQAASAIAAKYDVLIQAMQAKNKQVLGGYTENAARNGSLQYANDMETTFMSNEMDRASQRVADLVDQEQELILKSNTAYKNGDIKAFNAAQTALTKATADKTATIGKLLSATNAQVKTVQAQVKATQAKAKNDIAIAKGTAAAVVDAIRKSGVTDPATIKAYIAQTAANSGISDPTVLEAAVVTAGQTADKVDASLANTRSTIAKRGSTGGGSSGNKGGTDGTFNYTADDVTKLKNLLSNGTTDGTFAGRGADTYVDPGAYAHAYASWKAQGGTAAGFLKKAPLTEVNPASIPSLPADLQPKGTTPAPKHNM